MEERSVRWFMDHRYGWSDEIPDQMLDGSLPEGEKEFKCRKNWFYAVRTMVVQELGAKNVAEAPAFVRKFIELVGSVEFSLKERTTTDDIRLGNLVIDWILGSF